MNLETIKEVIKLKHQLSKVKFEFTDEIKILRLRFYKEITYMYISTNNSASVDSIMDNKGLEEMMKKHLLDKKGVLYLKYLDNSCMDELEFL